LRELLEERAYPLDRIVVTLRVTEITVGTGKVATQGDQPFEIP
jgi:hypothetical protein